MGSVWMTGVTVILVCNTEASKQVATSFCVAGHQECRLKRHIPEVFHLFQHLCETPNIAK